MVLSVQANHAGLIEASAKVLGALVYAPNTHLGKTPCETIVHPTRSSGELWTS